MLALGIFVMHTMGHPDHTSGSATGAASHASSTPMSHDPGVMSAGPAAPAAAGPADSVDASSTHEPGMPMDMTSLCVAVLFGAWVLAVLWRSALTRHLGWLAKLVTQVAMVRRPQPPPRGPDLTQLSVLRL